MSSVLLDTNILIYLLLGNNALKEILEDKVWFISFITEMELQMKPDITKDEIKVIQSLIAECSILEMNSAIKSRAIINARTYKLKLADSIILASAQTNNFSLITGDAAFKKIATETNTVLFIIP